MTHPGNDGIPQHAAGKTPFWENAPFRTIVSGVAVDVLLAVCLLVITTYTGDDQPDWRLLLALLVKTVLMALASGILKRVRPRQLTDRAA